MCQGRKNKGPGSFVKAEGFWYFIAQWKLLLFLFFPLQPDAFEGVLSLGLAPKTKRQVKLMWRRLTTGAVAGREEVSDSNIRIGEGWSSC